MSADSLRLTVSAVEMRHLALACTLAGVAPLLAAARNGPGVGRIQSEGDGTWLSWRAPGSALYGTPVHCTPDGTFLLADGEDVDKWIRVDVYAAHLLPAAAEAQVFLADVYNNAVGQADLSAAEAQAGDVLEYELSLTNGDATPLHQVRVWLDAATAGLELSLDGVIWFTPTSEAAGIGWVLFAGGATETLYLRRTIAPEADFNPGVLNLIHLGFWED